MYMGMVSIENFVFLPEYSSSNAANQTSWMTMMTTKLLPTHQRTYLRARVQGHHPRTSLCHPHPGNLRLLLRYLPEDSFLPKVIPSRILSSDLFVVLAVH